MSYTESDLVLEELVSFFLEPNFNWFMIFKKIWKLIFNGIWFNKIGVLFKENKRKRFFLTWVILNGSVKPGLISQSIYQGTLFSTKYCPQNIG